MANYDVRHGVVELTRAGQSTSTVSQLWYEDWIDRYTPQGKQQVHVCLSFGLGFFLDASYVPCMLSKLNNVIHSHDTPPEKTARDSFGIFSVSMQNALANGWGRGQSSSMSPGDHTPSRNVRPF